MSLVDVRELPPATRHAAADRIRAMRDFDLPELEWFNSSPCGRHTSLDDGLAQIPPCRRCGIRFRAHQRVGVAWLWMRGRGLIADQVGTGKTAQAAGLLACMKQSGELDDRRAVIVVRPSVLRQWTDELSRFLPKLPVATGTGSRSTRINVYCAPWDVLVIGFQMLVRDYELLERNFRVGAVIVDDIDPLRNPSNATAYAIKRLARRSERAVVLTATPLQKRLTELHSVLDPVGGLEVFGNVTTFRRRYVKEDLVKQYSRTAGRHVHVREFVGYQNLDEFKDKVRPLCLRRTPDDIDDVDLPTIQPNTVWLNLHPAQHRKYEELRRGVLQIIRAEGTTVKRPKAAAMFLYGAQICAGLTTIGEADDPGTSVKLDWVEHVLTGDLALEKVVVFCQFTRTVEALSQRLARNGVGHVRIWGREPSTQVRAQAQARFWDQPGCRVLIGTSAIEQGLNLQVARHLINVDQLLNPARMTQLAGRIRRDGSAHRTCYVHNLLTVGTQEEGYLDLLEREQALADHVWDEASELYRALPPLVLLQLIGRPTSTTAR